MNDDMIFGTDPRPIPRVASVTAGRGHALVVRWRDGAEARVNLSGWIGLHNIVVLMNEAVFSRPEVGEEGAWVQWAGDEDLAIDAVHLEKLADQQAAFGAAELIAWQERRHVSNQEAADLLGVAVNTWANYRAGATRVPRGVAIACRALDSDPTLFAAHYRPRRPGRPRGSLGAA